MQDIVNHLLSEGYKTYRLISKTNWNKESKKQAQKILEENKDFVFFKTGDFNSDESDFYVPCGFNSTYLKANFNAMQIGGLEVYFVKDKTKPFFVFGLVEINKSPTWTGQVPRLPISDKPLLQQNTQNR